MAKFHQHEWDMLPERAFRPRCGRFGSMTLEGGKGDSAPPPDPRLVAAQIKSMGIQDQALQQMMAINSQMAPLQREQLQFGLDSSRTAYSQAQADRVYALERRGLQTEMQDRIKAQADEFNQPGRMEQMAAEANADVDTAFSNVRGQSQRAMARRGINLSSGRAAALDQSLNIDQATAKANAANRVRAAARQEGYALTDRANNALAGYATQASGLSGAAAGYGSNGLSLTNSALAGLNSGWGQVNQGAASLGQNATGMYNTQMNAWVAGQNAKSEASGALLGSGMQAGAMMFAASDRRLKRDIELVGRDERTGLNLYEFSYIGGDGSRYIGVMADEVLRVEPEAVVAGEDGFMSVNYDMLGIKMVRVGKEN